MWCNVIGCEERHNSLLALGVCASLLISTCAVTTPYSSAGPANIFSVSSAGTAAPYQMTNTNKRLFERIRPSLCAAPQEFYFTGARGDTVQSWFLPPNGADDGNGGGGGGETKYPVVCIIHGGPQGAIMVSPHTLAAFVFLSQGPSASTGIPVKQHP